MGEQSTMGNKKSIPTVDQLLEEAQHLLDVTNEESALACALGVGASIEKAVLTLVGNYFVDCESAKEILSENGVLGTYTSRAKTAYCLGLISKGMFENIKKIGYVRNRFAHSNTDTDFNDPEVVGLCNKLTWPQLPQSIIVGKGKPAPKKGRVIPPRERFPQIGVSIFYLVLAKANSIEHKKQFTDEWDSK